LSFLLPYAEVFARPKVIEVFFLSEFESKNKSKISLSLIENASAQSEGGIKPHSGIGDNPSTDVITCDPKNYQQSIFCDNKSTEEKNIMTRPIEMFIDISSSFKLIDPPINTRCARLDFLEKVLSSCGKKISFYVYNTKRSLMNNKNEVCGITGNNDGERLLNWVRSSSAQKVILITDTFEMQKKFFDELKKMGAKFHGDKAGERFQAADLLKYVDLVCER
jgi:hypothetical protein